MKSCQVVAVSLRGDDECGRNGKYGSSPILRCLPVLRSLDRLLPEFREMDTELKKYLESIRNGGFQWSPSTARTKS